MRTAIITIGFIVFLFSFTSLQAEQVKIGISGQVDGVSDPYNYLENKIHKDDLITGFYTYDLSIPDSSPKDFESIYIYTSSPNGISLSAGGITFQTNPNDVDFEILLSDYGYDAPLDAYGIGSKNNLPILNNIPVSIIQWTLSDDTGNALSSPLLTAMPPDLSSWQFNRFSIGGGGFQFDGHITSVYLIPEPATLLLLGIGGLLLRKFKGK
jgi:hypothetical protein